MSKKYEVNAWAIINVLDDNFLPDLTHPTIGAFYHVCSKEGSAKSFVNKCNKGLEVKSWDYVPCKITYEV